MLKRIASSLVLLFLGCAAGMAQESRATLTGTITDPSGAAIPGATVIAKHSGTNAETKTTTNEAGLYVMPFLNTGDYTVTASTTGFKTAIKQNVQLSISERRQLDFQLEVGGTSEQVTVSAAAELLDTASANRGTLIDAQKIADLPLLGKNTYTLAYHANGILHINPQGSITDRPYDNGGMDALVINGGQAFTNEYLLDGAPNTNTERGRPGSLSFVPPPEAVEEMAVQSNNYDAQFGRTGGGVISATLKSGTNEIHGALYEYWRNKVLNANTFQGNRTNTPRGPFLWNQPGGTVNGPVYIPKLYNGKNKTFFLFSWEGIYQNIPNQLYQTVPTEANRAGDFSDRHTSTGQAITIYDPLTTAVTGNVVRRQPFPSNRIDPSRFDPVALNLLKFIPLPNVPADAAGLNNYFAQTGQVTKERYNAYTAKIDQAITNSERLSATYARNRRWQTGPSYGWPVPALGPNNFQRFNQLASAQLTSTLTPTMVVATRFGFTQHDFANFPNGGGFDPTNLGFPPNQVAQAQGNYFPGISMTNYTGFGGAGLNHDTSTNWYFTVSANKSLNKHSLKFGTEFRAILDNLPNYAFASFAFTNQWTQQDPNNASATAGNAFASFLMGYPASGSAPQNASPAFGSHYYGFYLQDDWRISKNLTLNIGGRWDYESPYTERYNRSNAGFDPSSPSPLQAPGLDVKGGLLFTSSGNRLMYPRDLNNFQPRLGIAWTIFPKTVFRAGYGLSYIPTNVTNITTQTQGFSTSTPFVASNDNTNYIPTGRLSNPFPSGMLSPAGSSLGLATFAGQGLSFVDQRRVQAYIHQFSAGFQHELPWHILIDASYVGSRTRALGVGKGIDEISAADLARGTTYLNGTVPNPFAGLLPGTSLNGANTTRRQLLRPYPQFTGITRNENPIGYEWYNSFQLQIQKRLTNGFHAMLTYTYSTTMGAVNYLNNQFADDQLEHVRTAEDLPHRASVLAGYELPFFKGSRGIVRAFLGGWQVQGILTMQSGRQLNGVDAYWTGVDPFISSSRTPDAFYFNACSVNTSGVRQNCSSATQPVVWMQRPSDTLRVAGSRWSQIREMRLPLLDSSIFKTFRLKERLQLQFRLEAFNTFNTPWFGQANSSFGNARFGLLGNSQTNDPRNTQLALKLNW
jgi:hypothetical protein